MTRKRRKQRAGPADLVVQLREPGLLGRCLTSDGRLRALGYSRVSTERQADDYESLESQNLRIWEFCNASSAVFTGFPSDTSSAFHPGSYNTRPSFQTLVQKCRDKMAVVVVTSIDRFSRDPTVFDVPGVADMLVFTLDENRLVFGHALRQGVQEARDEIGYRRQQIRQGLQRKKGRADTVGNKKSLRAAQRRGVISRIVHADIRAERIVEIRRSRPELEAMSWNERASAQNAAGFRNCARKSDTVGKPWTKNTLRGVWDRASRLMAEQEELDREVPDFGATAPLPAEVAAPSVATGARSGPQKPIPASLPSTTGKAAAGRQRPAQRRSGGGLCWPGTLQQPVVGPCATRSLSRRAQTGDGDRDTSLRAVMVVAPTADAGYPCAKIYAGLERRRIGAVIPANRLGFLNRRTRSDSVGRPWTRSTLRPVWKRASRVIEEQAAIQAAELPDWAAPGPSGQGVPLRATEKVTGSHCGVSAAEACQNKNYALRGAQRLSVNSPPRTPVAPQGLTGLPKVFRRRGSRSAGRSCRTRQNSSKLATTEVHP